MMKEYSVVFLILFLTGYLFAEDGLFLLSDFEKKDYNSILEGKWEMVSDEGCCKGTSKGTLQFVKGQGGSTSSVRLEYKLGRNWGSSPFVNFTLKFDNSIDIYHGIKGIKFWLRGNRNKFRVVFPSENIIDWNFWGYIIDVVDPQWKEMVIYWTDLKPGWGSTKDLSESLAKVREIQFHTEGGQEGEENWLEIDDVSLILDQSAAESPLFLEIKKREQKKSQLFIDVNQAFYMPSGKKQAVVRCREEMAGGRFSIENEKNETVLQAQLKSGKKYWDQYFWIIDFSRIKTPGAYTIKALFNDKEARAKIFINTEFVLEAVRKTLNYFFIQRCGQEVPDWHKACHLDDARKPDGSSFNAVGGWHDCAGFDKEMYTTFLPVYVYTTIAMQTEKNDWSGRILEEAKWGADWIMRMTDQKGYTWCHVDPHNLSPEEVIRVWSKGVDTDNITGTADDRKLTVKAWGPEESCQASCAGALAKLGFYLKDKDQAYSEQCLEKARLIYDFLKAQDYYREKIYVGKGDSHYIIFHSGMLLADIYLYQAGKEKKYLDDAVKQMEYIITKCRSAEGEFLNSPIEKVPMSGKSFDTYFNLVCFYEFYKNFPDHATVKRIRTVYKNFFEKQADNRIKGSPYGQAQLIDADLKDWIAVNSFQRSFEKPGANSKISQGKNCYWLSLAVISFYANEILDTKKYTSLAIDQIDWVLGKNPFGLSTVAEVGYNFPRMFHMFYWMKDHPCADGVIPGGVINGIGGDQNDFPWLDLGNSNYMAWETNEYWNPPTAWFALACWEYYKTAVNEKN